MVSGPQGPRVVLDGKPVLLLCSSNYLGLADHPRVREAAADAAMRWGAGAGASRLASGNMTLLRRLEERLAAFQGTQRALLFGSGYLANSASFPALAGKGEIVFSDELNPPRSSTAAASPAPRWSCTATPMPSIWLVAAPVRRARRADRHRGPCSRRTVTWRRWRRSCASRAATTCGSWSTRRTPSARSARAAGARWRRPGWTARSTSSCGSLGTALGAYGGTWLRRVMARYLVNDARPLVRSTGLPPAAAAAALAALELLEEQPRRVDRLQDNAGTLRDELAREGFDVPAAGRTS